MEHLEYPFKSHGTDEENIMKQGSSFVILIFLFITLLAACKVKDISTPPATLTSIVVTPTDPSIAPGTTTQLTAIGTYSSGSKQNITSTVVWDSSDTTIATISNSPGSQGLVTAATSTTGTVRYYCDFEWHNRINDTYHAACCINERGASGPAEHRSRYEPAVYSHRNPVGQHHPAKLDRICDLDLSRPGCRYCE